MKALRKIFLGVCGIALLSMGVTLTMNLVSMWKWVTTPMSGNRNPEAELRKALVGQNKEELTNAFKEVVAGANKRKETFYFYPSAQKNDPEPQSDEALETQTKATREELVSLLHSRPDAWNGSTEESVKIREKILDLALRVGEGNVEEYLQDSIQAASLLLSSPSPDVSTDRSLKQRMDQLLLRSQSFILSNANNPRLALELTQRALTHVDDPAMRDVLRGQLEAQYPDLASQLPKEGENNSTNSVYHER